MTAEQLVFDLARRPALGREDFLIAPSNQNAMNLIDAWPEWQGRIALIHGPRSSGKTHIAEVWASKADAVLLQGDTDLNNRLAQLQADFPAAILIDNAEKFFEGDAQAQDFLFHLINEVKNHPGSCLLMTSGKAPSEWNIKLKDLESRLKSTQIVAIEVPDEMLLMGVLVKQLSDHQLTVDPDVVSFIISRTERSFESVIHIVNKIDAASLKEKRRITLPFVKKILSI